MNERRTVAQGITDAVATIVATVEETDGPVIAEIDLVRRVLEFANTGRPIGLPGAPVAEHGGQSFMVVTPELDRQHADLRRDLEAIVAGELSGPASARLRKLASHQVMVPVFEFERGGAVRTSYRRFVRDLDALVAYVLLRIRSDDQLRDDVKRCRLPGCPRFFLASDSRKDPSAPGRRRYRYCSREHEKLAPGASGAQRTARWREKQARLAATKHK